MIAKQTVYLNFDRTEAVPEGHADAKFLLVREGHDIEESLVEKHDAMELVNSASNNPPPAPAPSREAAPPPNAAPATASTASPAKAPKAKKARQEP